MKMILRTLSLAMLASLSGVYAQLLVIPQVADGGGWATTIVLTNTSATVQTVALSFNKATSGGATAPWTPPFMETVTLSAISLPAGATLFLHTPGTASTLTQGWGQLTAAASVVGYAIFTSHAPGNPAQDATAPAVAASSRILVPFDNTSHLITAAALVNPNATGETVSVNIRTSDGTITTGSANLPANGQQTFLMPTQFPATAGKSGLAEFFTNTGTISAIALRANPSGAFTTAPVYPESGAPVIGANDTPIDIGVSALRRVSVREFIPAPQVQVIPQVADGNGWASTIVLVNTKSTSQIVSLTFHQSTAGGGTSLWTPPFEESVSLTNLNLPAGSALFLHTPGTAATLTQGWGELDGDLAVAGYAIFTSAAPGNPAQDATAPAGAGTTRILVPFDNTSGFIAAIAVANPNALPEPISVNIRTSDGSTSTGALPSLPAEGQTTFLMPTQFPGTAGKSGLAEFFVTSGSFSIIALRANPSGAFTAAPVYFESGPPIISTGAGGTGPSMVVGAFVVDKITSSTLGSSIELDLISGGFSRFSTAEYDVFQGQIHVGPCYISDFTYDPNGVAPNAPDALLNAGTSIPVSGPNLPSGSAMLPLPGGTGPTYSLMPGTGVLDSGTYTMAGNGGTDIGPFTVSGHFPDDFTVNNWASYTSIDRATPLTVSWTGTGFSSVLIVISSQVFNATSNHTASVSCNVPATPASFTFTTDLLSHLLAVDITTFSGLGFMEVAGSNLVQFTAKEVKTGANVDQAALQLARIYQTSLSIK